MGTGFSKNNKQKNFGNSMEQIKNAKLDDVSAENDSKLNEMEDCKESADFGINEKGCCPEAHDSAGTGSNVTSNSLSEDIDVSSGNPTATTENSGVDGKEAYAKAEQQSSEKVTKVKNEMQCDVSSTNVSGKSSLENDTCIDTNSTSTETGTNNIDRETAEEKEKIIGTTPVSNIDKEQPENGSVTLSKTENGQPQAKYACNQSREMSSVDAEISDSYSDISGKVARNESCGNEKNSGGTNKPSVPNDKTASSTSDETEHQPVSASKNGNKQTYVDASKNGNKQTTVAGKDAVQCDKKNKNETNMSKATKKDKYLPSDNLYFYRNKINSRPFPGEKIVEMLKWKGDYLKLERSHSYIQWLFPIQESRGMNFSAQPLEEHEAKAISEDKTLRARVLEAFKMMLDFYGMELVDEREVKRADNWKERYEHLDRSFHNRFRITRILRAIGELGFEYLQEPWLEFVIKEATINEALPSLNGNSMEHWIGAVHDEATQGRLYHLLSDLNSQLLAKHLWKLEDEKHAGNDEVGVSGDNAGKGVAKEIVGENNIEEGNENRSEEATENGTTEEVDSATCSGENAEETKTHGKKENAENKEQGIPDTVPEDTILGDKLYMKNKNGTGTIEEDNVIQNVNNDKGKKGEGKSDKAVGDCDEKMVDGTNKRAGTKVNGDNKENNMEDKQMMKDKQPNENKEKDKL